MKPNVITDCNNCSHKEVCGMKDAPQKTRDKINTAEWWYSEKFSAGLGDWLARNKMEISIRCPHYLRATALMRGITACSDSSNPSDKSE